jgi:DNA-binding CsgD family transcriptional regulator
MSGFASAADGPRRSPAWSLVGRRSELERITAARAEGATGVVLVGPAGVGKSRLARAAVDDAREIGKAQTSWAQATRSAATVPLGAFAGLIPDDVRSDEPLELLRRSVESLRESGGGRPVVLGVDDAQLLDPTSAALVLQVAMTGTAFVVATVRSGEPCPDAIVSLWKDAGAQRLELGLLSAEETADLAEAIVGGPLEQAARRWAWASSHGNALYVRELVGGALDSGALASAGDLWQLRERPPVAASLADLVTGRMVDLDRDGRAVLELLAIGEPLSVDELVDLAGADALLAVEERGLIDATAVRSVRLAHPLYGEVLAAGLGVLRLRQLRLQLAKAVQARPGTAADDALRVAHWLLDAGEPIPIGLLVEAGRTANLAGDPDLGARFATLAIEVGAGVEGVLLLGRAHTVRKRFAEAEAVLAPIEGRLADQQAAIDYLEQRAISVLHWGLQQPDAAQALLQRAQAWWPDQEWQRRLDPLRLQLASLMGGFDATLAVSADILSDPDLAPEVRAQLEPVHTVTLFYTGRTREAYDLGERIRPTVPLRDQSDALALVAWSIIGLETGADFPGLDTWMSRTLQDGVRAGDHDAAGVAAITIGGVRFLEGRYVDATRWLAEAALHLEVQDAFGTLIAVRATQVGVAYGMGDHAATAAALATCRVLPAWSEPLPSLLPYVVRAEAWAACDEGEHARAQRMLLDGAQEIASMRVYAALLTYEALRAGAPAATIVDPLCRLAERCDCRSVATYADHATALAAGDGAAVLGAAEEFAAIGLLRYAMETAAGAASLFAQEGRQDSARRAAARARELHALGQGGTPPHLEGLDPVATELTPREAQLVELARRGLSNAEIADRLVLSVRTVESHLYRAMQKLGVGDRHDL